MSIAESWLRVKYRTGGIPNQGRRKKNRPLCAWQGHTITGGSDSQCGSTEGVAEV